MATRALPAARPHQGTELGAFLRHVDYLLLAAVGGVIAYGLWVLGAITRHDVPGDSTYYIFRQEIYVAVGVVALAAVTAINPDVYRRHARVLYALALVLLLLVFPLGERVRGSQRWIEFGSFRFQPSELGKVLLVLFLAGFVADRAKRVGEWRVVWSVVGLAAVPIVFVFKEPDFGSALVYGSAAAAVLFFAGAPWKHLAVLLAAAEDFRPIVVAGAEGPASELREALRVGGDGETIRDLAGRELSAYDVEGAGLLLYVVAGDQVSPDDEKALMLADRKGVEALCLLAGTGAADPVDVPYVLATNVVRVLPGAPPPVEEPAERIADSADERAYMWAARLPVLRKAVVEQTIHKFSLQNGILGVAIFIPGADLPA